LHIVAKYASSGTSHFSADPGLCSRKTTWLLSRIAKRSIHVLDASFLRRMYCYSDRIPVFRLLDRDMPEAVVTKSL